MALYRCSSGGGTAILTETVLWSNSPSATTFADSFVNLSDSITNYDYIGIYYRPIGADLTTPIMHMIYPVSDWTQMTQSTSYNGALMFANVAGTYYGRIAWYSTATKVHITNAFKLDSSGTHPNASVPVEIVGLKLETS